MTAAVLGFVLRHEALVGWAAVLVSAALLGGLAAHRLDAPRLAQTRSQVEAARTEAAGAAASAHMATAAAAAVETARTRETTLTHSAEEAADAVVHAPQAETPVPPDVLRDWALGVDRLRDQAAAARAPAADPGGAGAARSLPAP